MKQQRCCNHALIPAVEDAPMAIRRVKEPKTKRRTDFVSAFATAKHFDLLATHDAKSLQRPPKKLVSSVRTFRVGTKKYARKGTPFCRSAPPHGPTTLASAPTVVQGIAPQIMPPSEVHEVPCTNLDTINDDALSDVPTSPVDPAVATVEAPATYDKVHDALPVERPQTPTTGPQTSPRASSLYSSIVSTSSYAICLLTHNLIQALLIPRGRFWETESEESPRRDEPESKSRPLYSTSPIDTGFDSTVIDLDWLYGSEAEEDGTLFSVSCTLYNSAEVKLR